MNDLISRSALLEHMNRRLVGLRDCYGSYDGYANGYEEATDRVEEAPAVDAVPVVRCRDCDKSIKSPLFGAGWRFCKNNSQHHKDDHFCSYGER